MSACVMRSGGTAILKLTAAPGVVCTPEEGSVRLKSDNLQVDVWLVRDANTVDDAAGRIPQVIDSEFKEFKETSTTSLTVAGAAAKRLMGTGREADDNDPGTADVVVFQVGGRVFVACTHEEHLKPVAQEWMMTVVRTAQMP